MFDDLVYEGADSPPALDPDFRAPPGNEKKEGLDRWEWRVDGVFIVAAHTARALRNKIGDVEDIFHVGDANSTSMKIAFRKDGQLRPGADRGKEQYVILLPFLFGSWVIDTNSNLASDSRITSLSQRSRAWMIPRPRVNPMPVLPGSSPLSFLILQLNSNTNQIHLPRTRR